MENQSPSRSHFLTGGRRGWINYIVLAVVVLALVIMVDLRGLALAILSIPPLMLLLALVIASLDRFVMGYKWRHLILAVGGKISLGSAVSAYYQSGISSRLLPIPMASDLLRAHVVGQVGLPLEVIVSSITLEKIIAWLASTLLAVAGMIYLFLYVDLAAANLLWVVLMASVGLACAGLILLLCRPAHEWGGRLSERYLPAKLSRLLHKFSRALLAYRDHPRALFANLLLAFGEQAVQIAKFLVLGRALGIDLPLIPLLVTIVLMLTVRRILNYFESWGIAEAGTVVMLTLLGINETTAVALIFLNFVVTTVASLPGIYLMVRSGLNLQSWMKGKERPATPKL
ncbi:MAG: flippase-like domain-containing protein [Caldilineaceae bacterium]|nr:flippase-like domain-containing protein [Caldilineaceae bacterium]